MWFRPLTDDAAAILSAGEWHGRLARVYRHWCSLAPLGSLPAYSQLQLSSLAPDLRFLAAVAIESGEFRFTSVGDEIAERYGRSMSGSYLADQFVGPSQLDLIAAHRASTDLATPVICAVKMEEVDLSSRVPFQLLLLPFGDDAGVVDHVLWVMAFPT